MKLIYDLDTNLINFSTVDHIKDDDRINSFFELIPVQSFNVDDLMVNLSLDNDLIDSLITKSPVLSDVLKGIGKDNKDSSYDPKSILGEDLYNDLYDNWVSLNSDDSDNGLYNELNKKFLNRFDEIEEDAKYSTLNPNNDLTDKYGFIFQTKDFLLKNWDYLSKDVFYDKIPSNVLSDIKESLKTAKNPNDLTNAISNVCCDLLYSYIKHRDDNLKSDRYESHILEDYDKVLLERKKKITESIFKLFQKFLWQYVKDKDYFAVTGSKQIFGKKYLTIQHLPSGTILYIKTHAPFTLRYEARAVRVLDNTILNYRDTNMGLSDLQKADEIVCNWFRDLISAYEGDLNNLDISDSGIKDLINYAKIWINLVKLTLDTAPHTLSRLDLNLNVPDGKLKRNGFRDVSILDLLIKWFETIYKFDSANNVLRGVRGINYDSFYFKPRIKNHPHVSVYNKNEDTRTKLAGSEDRDGLIDTIGSVIKEITLIQKELSNIEQNVKDRDPETIVYQRRLYGKLFYLQKLLPILKKQREQLEDSLKDDKKIYRIELRFFKDALYRAIQKATNKELKTADLKAICSLDDDILKKIVFTALKEMCDNYDPLRYVYRTSDDQDEVNRYYRDISSGFGISPVAILKFIADNDRKATIDELVEHGFTYQRNVYKKGEEVFYLNKGDKYTIPEGERASVSFDEESDKVKIVRETKELMGTEEKKVSKSTISDKVKILQDYGMVLRCKGHIAITDEGLHFLGRGERSITLVYRVLVLGCNLDGGYGNTKKEINQSYANSTSDYVLKFEIFNGYDRDPPPDT